jgi:hypothetical protein
MLVALSSSKARSPFLTANPFLCRNSSFRRMQSERFSPHTLKFTKVTMGGATASGGRVLPSERTIAFAISVVASKPPELSVAGK